MPHLTIWYALTIGVQGEPSGSPYRMSSDRVSLCLCFQQNLGFLPLIYWSNLGRLSDNSPSLAVLSLLKEDLSVATET